MKLGERVYDVTGREVHKTILPLYLRRNHCKPLLEALGIIRAAIEQGRKEEDPVYMAIGPCVLDHLDSAYDYIKAGRLMYVCGFCQGKLQVTGQPCPHCHDRGLMTKDQWDRGVPQELKIGLK